jgi:hypothetical protein
MTLGRFGISLGLPLLVCCLASCTKVDLDRTAAATPDTATVSTAPLAAPATPARASAPQAQKVSARPAGPLHCGLRGSGTLGETGVADLQVGRTISAVKQSCLVTRDAVGPWIEGITQRVLTVIVGSERLYAAVDGGIISGIAVRTPRFATSDGLRVGSQLSGFVSAKRVKMAEGEQGLYLRLPSHCGLAFHFAIQSRAQPGIAWPSPKLAREHGRAPVDQIIVTRCTQ